MTGTIVKRTALVAGIALILMGAQVGSDDWKVSLRRIGPVWFGMDIAEARRVLEDSLQYEPPTGCDYVFPTTAPDGISFMVSDGRIVRVDVDGPGVSTISGAQVGDSETRLLGLYSGRLEVEPHKYIDGKYLIFVPRDSADADYRVVFETDGNQVIRYRAGLLPEVLWVEGCA